MPALTVTGSPVFNIDGSCTITPANGDRVQAPAAGLTVAQGWVACRFKTAYANTTLQVSPDFVAWVFDWEDSISAQIVTGWQNNVAASAGGWYSGRGTPGASQVGTWKGDTFTAGTHKTIIFRWTASTWNQSIDGGTWGGDVTDLTIPTINATLFDIGNRPASTPGSLGDIYWLAWGTGTLSDADAATIGGFGDNDHLLGDFPGSCIGIWNATDATFLSALPYSGVDDVSGFPKAILAHA